jgi:hypothetical protein
MEAMHQLQFKNNEHQGGMPMELKEEKTSSHPASTLSLTPLHPVTSLEPKVSLPDKFDGTNFSVSLIFFGASSKDF